MDWVYDAQIKRYVTQFMRVFIGFKWKSSDGDLRSIPVMYGDMNRQVANIIKENSENKLPTVPRIACYISGLEMDMKRLSDATFVSKVHLREREYTVNQQGQREYGTGQGGNYTVERLMPTPYLLEMKTDIWASNTDQKLQIFEQIGYLFNPTLEIQSTDNFLDWTSITTLSIKNLQFSSRSVPQGVDTDIDVMSLTFEIPIWISPPAKVKRLGVIQTIIANVFTEQGDVVDLKDLAFNQQTGNVQEVISYTDFPVLLFKSEAGGDYDYDLTIADRMQAIIKMGLEDRYTTTGEPVDWNAVLEVLGGYQPGSTVRFQRQDGYEIVGTFVINPTDASILTVTLDQDTVPANTLIDSSVSGLPARGTVDAIVDPYRFNPIEKNMRSVGVRFLVLEDINPEGLNSDGPAAWKNLDGTDPVIAANSIIEWDGNFWRVLFNPAEAETPTYVQNLKTGIQYRWDGSQWLKSFEGEYRSGSWTVSLNR